jgi:hypothetical protein
LKINLAKRFRARAITYRRRKNEYEEEKFEESLNQKSSDKKKSEPSKV